MTDHTYRLNEEYRRRQETQADRRRHAQAKRDDAPQSRSRRRQR